MLLYNIPKINLSLSVSRCLHLSLGALIAPKPNTQTRWDIHCLKTSRNNLLEWNISCELFFCSYDLLNNILSRTVSEEDRLVSVHYSYLNYFNKTFLVYPAILINSDLAWEGPGFPQLAAGELNCFFPHPQLHRIVWSPCYYPGCHLRKQIERK